MFINYLYVRNNYDEEKANSNTGDSLAVDWLGLLTVTAKGLG